MDTNSKDRKWLWLSGSLLLMLVGALTLEWGVRYLGYADFPIYDTDQQIGYIPHPNQAGNFAHKYPWYFNEHSMRNQPFVANPETGILLIGDSIVFGGGIDYLPCDRLGECLQSSLGGQNRVWSIAAGSWSFLNELTYLERNPDVVAGVRKIVWVVNYGDWDHRTEWSSELTHPRSRPLWSTYYLAQKLITRKYGHFFNWGGSTAEEPCFILNETAAKLKHLPKTLWDKIILVWYPFKEQEQSRSQDIVKIMNQVRSDMIAQGNHFFDVKSDSRWKLDFYRDGAHPTAEGNHILGEIIAEQLIEHEAQ